MSMITKGEWTATKSMGGYVVGNSRNWIARLFHKGGGFGVNSLAPPDSEVKDNAQLIAATPDLYEALKELRTWLKSDGVKLLGQGFSEQLGIPKTFDKVDRALAKAEGK